jgi:hypothetical protein
MWSTWTSKALSEDRRAVLVELSPFAVFPQVLQKSALGFSDPRTDRSRCKHFERSTSPVLGRHYRVRPQRLVDDSLTEGSSRCICGAKPPGGSIRSAAFPVAGSTPEGVRTALRRRAGQAPSAAKPDARSHDERGVSDVGRSFGSTRCAATSDCANANNVATSFTWTRAEARGRVLPRRVERGRSLERGAEATLLVAHGRSCEVPRGFPRGVGERFRPPKRVCTRTITRGMPPTGGPPKRNAGARHAAGMRRLLPWGSAPFGV